jgi:phosphomannomutase/phosphoglucomutase
VRLLEILSQSEHSLDDLIDQFPSTSYTPEILIPVADETKFALMADILGKAKFTGGRASTLDGLRIDYTDGWGLIRASNTTPNLTLRFEAETDDGLTAIKQQFLTALTPFIHQLENYL